MTITTEDIREEFEAFGIQVKSEVLLEKCIGFCCQYSLAADELAASWLSYAANHHHDEMTTEYLDSLEREQLSKKKNAPISVKKGCGGSVLMYSTSTIDQLQAEEDLIMTYSASPMIKKTTTGRPQLPPGSSPLPPTTPRSLLRRGNTGMSSPHVGHLSPTVAQPSERYSSRTNSGSVAANLLTDGLVTEDLVNRRWTAQQDYVPKFEISSLSNGVTSQRVMFEKLRETAVLQEEAILYMAEQIAPAFMSDEHEADYRACWSAMDQPSNERIHCVGRVCCDSVGKLNAASVLLEGSRELAGAKVLPLDLTDVQQYALFPGQVIGVSGVNTTGSCLVVDEVVGGRVPSYPLQPITITQQTGPVQLVVACGPFTTTGNLLYEPLDDLLTCVASDPPHLLVLLGPLLDATHPLLLSKDMTETYQDVVDRVLGMVAAALAKCPTEVLILASGRDATSSTVYPTHPLPTPHALPSPRLHLLSDPSMVVVEGVAVALTAVDVVMDLGKEEMASPGQQGDRLSRLVQHVLAQQVLYPLSPAPDHVSLSPQLLHAHASLNCKPHLMLLPSGIRNFVKDVCGCVAVNPERLCKGVSGGSYARIELQPPTQGCPDRPKILAAVYKI